MILMLSLLMANGRNMLQYN